ncbi:unnamed protein product [Rotaria sp. Silwood2]|nr:unnamed protein product [Rotaria sp. Silwood2]
MLLAVEIRRTDKHGNMQLIVGVVPCDDCIITRGCRAFVVGICSEDANRVRYYCSTCYPVLDKLTESQLKCMQKCAHIVETNGIHEEEIGILDQSPNIQENEHAIICMWDADVTQPLISSQIERRDSRCLGRNDVLSEEDVSSFDSTGMFYFTPSRQIEDAVIDVNLLRDYRALFRGKRTTYDRTTVPKHPLRFKDRHTDEADLQFFLTTPFASGTNKQSLYFPLIT